MIGCKRVARSLALHLRCGIAGDMLEFHEESTPFSRRRCPGFLLLNYGTGLRDQLHQKA
jgi:hypothetical protein